MMLSANNLSVRQLAAEIKPHVRAGMSGPASLVLGPFLVPIIQVVLWVLITMFGKQVSPLLQALITTLGSSLKPEVAAYLRAVDVLLNPWIEDIPREIRVSVGVRPTVSMKSYLVSGEVHGASEVAKSVSTDSVLTRTCDDQ